MGPLRVAVAGVRAGQGATGYAAALAWSSAADRATMLVDADGAGGTVASLLGIEDSRSLATAYSPHGVAVADLERQAIPLRSRPRLRVVPGFRDPGRPGSHTAEVLLPALERLPEELVVVDVGTPFAYPDLVDRLGIARSLAAAFHAVLIVLRTESDLLDSAIHTLRALAIPRSRLILVRPAHRRGVAEASALLADTLPTYPVAAEWEWNPERCVAARARAEPMVRPLLAEELGLFGSGTVVTDSRRRWWPDLRRQPGESP